MALQNIGAGNKDDAFYRYKMPKMITKIEGRGNGIKTNIVNMVDIAKALGRPASYTIQYLCYELGTHSPFNDKTGIPHIYGAHDAAKLARLLDDFIKKFVQCYGCGNPETQVIITKSQMINLKCAACGFISEVDMRERLTTFIIKDHAKPNKGSNDKKLTRRAEKGQRLRAVAAAAADEELKKQKKEASKSNTKSLNSPAQDTDDDDDDVQWQTDTSSVAALQTIQQQLNAVTASMVMLSTNGVKAAGADKDEK